LDNVAGAEVAGVERFAIRESFVLAMIKPDAVFAELPTEINFLLVDYGREVKQADVQVLDEASGFENAIERGLERFGKPVVFHTDRGQFFVRNDHSAHHHDAGRNRREFAVQAREFLAGIHGLDKKGFEFLARALRFRQGKNALRRFRSFILLLIVVFFICHDDSVSGDSVAPRKESRLGPVLFDASAN
jgi:hypothetical protein